MSFAGEGVVFRRFGGAGVSEQATKDIGEEIGEESSFVEVVQPARSDEIGPALERGLPFRDALWQSERAHLLSDYFRVEERLGFKSHWINSRVG